MKYLLPILLCLCGLLGCSRLDIAVNWADTYIVSQADDYFDLNSAQSKELKNEVQQDIRKVRKELFPKWARSLRELEKETHTPLTEEGFHKYFQESLEEGRTLQPYFAETAAKFITQARPEQLEHFEKAIRKKNVEDEKKVQNGQQARDESRKKYLRWTEMWINSLTKDQEQLLNRHLAEHPFPLEKQIQNKNHALEKFTAARLSPETLRSFVRDYVQDRGQYNDPDYQLAIKNYQSDLEKFVYQLALSLNDKQKKALSENLLEKASALEKLAAKD